MHPAPPVLCRWCGYDRQRRSGGRVLGGELWQFAGVVEAFLVIALCCGSFSSSFPGASGEGLFIQMPSTTSLDRYQAPANRQIRRKWRRILRLFGSKNYEIAVTERLWSTTDRSKRDFSSGSPVLNEVVLVREFSEAWPVASRKSLPLFAVPFVSMWRV
jgi:hypothetical protein